MMTVDVYPCPCCGDDLAVINLVDFVTFRGTLIGETMVKCRSGCSKNKILYSGRKFKPEHRKQLSNRQFIEMIEYARSQGRRINGADKERELLIKLNNQRRLKK